MKRESTRRRIELGRHIVADPEICGGQPTFKGTRIMVWIVLEQLDDGLARPTFFTLDGHFYRWDWAPAVYCLVWLDVRRREAAEVTQRFLRHPAFDTQPKRMGPSHRCEPMGPPHIGGTTLASGVTERRRNVILFP